MIFANLISHRKYDFISLLSAVVIVTLCALCITPDEVVHLKKQTKVPYISVVQDNVHIEQSFSAGFFLPTSRNVNCHATIPALKCNVEVIDMRSINVFNGREKSSIVYAIDLLPNTMPYNILSEIHISEVNRLADMDLNVMADRTFCENILAGDKYNVNYRNIGSESSVLLCKIGNMAFSSPSEFFQVLPEPEGEQFLDNGHGNTKFLRLKPFQRER
ncbi:MAG: hypothetical protein LBB16_00840 [Puniceicoccales bacterium]|jgi:hypothetical protein|nr:hypothetical protein [Puniceicoccales bacterium]